MTGPGGSQGTYRFDAMGRRVKRTWKYSDPWGTRSGSAIYIHGTSDELLVEYKNETVSYAGTENTTTYNIQMGGQLVARRVIGTGQPPLPRTEWLHRNHLNQVVGADWGSDIFSTGQIAGYSQPYNSGGSDQFQGHKDDPETGLHYNLARSYSPGMARWISADVMSHVYDPPVLNKYAYCRSDPIDLIDPDGADPVSPWDQYWDGERWVTFIVPDYKPFRSSQKKQPRQQRGDREVIPSSAETTPRRDQLKSYLDNIGPGCKKFFGGDAAVSVLKNKADSLFFYDIRIEANQNIELRLVLK